MIVRRRTEVLVCVIRPSLQSLASLLILFSFFPYLRSIDSDGEVGDSTLTIARKGAGLNSKWGKRALVLLIVTVLLVMSVAAVAVAASGPGPATNAGDGVSDGSGLAAPFGSVVAPGAPNAGDGIADGSGW
jgi:hypothetical protein